MPIKAFALELKQLSEQGEFEGFAATYGNIDQGGDVIEAGAFTKTIEQGGATRPLLYGHQDVIGVCTLTDTPKGLAVRGRFALGVQRARETYELAGAGAIKGLSVGYRAVKDDMRSGIRYLSELKLYEVSLTWAPMNEQALVTSVKTVQQELEIKTALDQFRRDILQGLEKK